MALATGSRIGAYEILSSLGAGGMGEVYRARDTRLQRDVALKVLPDLFAHDPERLARFEREARTLAALNHPHIAHVYGLELVGPSAALVMELVEGETLADRIATAAVPIEETIAIARQIAAGVQAAHDHGVIHRDLKPANIKITPDGTVKVLDFGLAKAAQGVSAVAPSGAKADGSGDDRLNSPTITTPAMTQAGMILGTAAYMSPEQAKGRAVDKRTDIWAFGCVVYEMLTGKRAFDGDDVSETIASILRDPPDWSLLPRDVPAWMRSLLADALARDPRERIADLAVIGYALKHRSDSAPAVVTRPSPAGRLWIASAVAGILGLIAGVVGTWLVTTAPEAPAAPPARVEILLPEMFGFTMTPVVSPDGRHIVLRGGPTSGLWLRSMESGLMQRLQNTAGVMAVLPAWSPNSRSFVFVVERFLKRFDLDSNATTTITTLPEGAIGLHLAWGSRDIVLLSSERQGIFQVAASGGTLSSVTVVEPDQRVARHASPSFLPDGRRFLFKEQHVGDASAGDVFIGSLDGGNPIRLGAMPSPLVQFVPPDRVVYNRDNRILVQTLDLRAGRLRDDAQAVVEIPTGIHSASTSVLAWAESSAGATKFRWLGRDGSELRQLDLPGPVQTFDLSSDGARLVVAVSPPGDMTARHLWTIDTERGTTTRATIGNARDVDPRWSPDNRTVIFGSTRDPARSPYRTTLTGAAPERLFEFQGASFSLDDWRGDNIVYHDSTGRTLWVRDAAGQKPAVVAATMLSGIVDQAQMSPDGRFIAFNANESGRFEVFVVPFPPTGDRWQISTRGGIEPTWRADGRELYFLDTEGMLMAVDVTMTPQFVSGQQTRLFKVALGPASGMVETYMPAPDGRRFLVLDSASDSNARLGMLINWQSLLKR